MKESFRRAGLVALLSTTSILAAPVYTLTVLGELDNLVTGMAINNHGHVVNGRFVYANGTVMSLELPGAFVFARGINDRGQVVGNNDFLRMVGSEQAFLYSDGTMHALGTLPSDTDSVAFAINNSGQVVGQSFGSEGGRAFLYSNGMMAPLGTPPGAVALDINDHSQIVGDHERRAFLYSTGIMYDLGTLPGHTIASATAINELGQVVGISGGSYWGAPWFYGGRAFLYTDGTMQDLGELPGQGGSGALDINNRGQVVGNSGDRAFVYRNGIMYDLSGLVRNAAGWTVNTAYAINDAGQIAGWGSLNDGPSYGLLLTPEPAPVPEPGTYALCGLALAGLACLRRLTI